MEEAPNGLLLLPDSRFREEAARTVREAAVDGFIVYSAPQNDPRVEAAIARRLPVVTVDQPRGAETPFVGIDDRAGARSAAEHLRGLGHKRVAVLSFTTSLDPHGKLELDLSTERLEGYKEGLGEAWDPSLVRVCRPNAPEPAREATLELLGEPEPPTAILAMTDTLALGALQAAAELASRCRPTCPWSGSTTVRSPRTRLRPSRPWRSRRREEAGLAAQWLVEDVQRGAGLRGKRPAAILPTELLVRESTAPPRG